jgi:UDP-glucose 4-epimerase
VKYLVTGGAGFIGSWLVDALLARGDEVVVYDNLSTGALEFLKDALASSRFRLIEGDIADSSALGRAMSGCEMVFHLAANADVRFGTRYPRKDLEQNTLGTFCVLEAMRAVGARRIAFSSTGSVYGEPSVFPTPEAAPFPVQTSLYAASKLAGEGLISAYCEGFGFQSWIFRFVSILGERYSHGHVFDFYRKLLVNPREIEVLGDGKQRKSYLYVQDCVAAMLHAVDAARAKVNILNLGTDEYCSVDESLRWLCRELGLSPSVRYGGGSRGWVGDSPFIFLDCSRMRQLGWKPTVSIEEGVLRTLRYLTQNHWLLESPQ